jgi:hypothetical protein
MKKVFLLIVVPALLVALGFAQTPAPSSNPEQTNIKGCLGGSDGNYTLVEDNTGHTFKITTSSVDFKQHLGHEVSLVGQKASGAGSAAADNSFAVTELNMISEHCAVVAAAPVATDSTPAKTTVAPPDAATAAPVATIVATTSATVAETAVKPAAPAATVSTPAEIVVTPAVDATAPAVAPVEIVAAPVVAPAIVAPAAETASAPAVDAVAPTADMVRLPAHSRRLSATPDAVATTTPAETASTPSAPASTSDAAATTPAAPASTPDAAATTPAVAAAAPARHGTLFLLIAFAVVVIVIGTLVPFLGRWRRRKALERTGAPNLSFTEATTPVAITREAISDEDKPEQPRKAA